MLSKGFPKVLNSDLPLIIRITWFFLAIIFVVGLVLSLKSQLMEYFEFNTVLSTSFHHSTDTPFPVITICNLNSFNTLNGRSFLNEIQSSFNKSFKLNNNEYFNYSSLKHIKEHLDYAKAILFENKTIYNNKSNLESYNLKLDYLFISCYFGDQMCNTSDFEYFYDTKYTNCYRFNSGLNRSNQSIPIKKMFTYGDDLNSFQMELYLGRQDFNNTLDYLAVTSGIYISIQNQSYKGILPNSVFTIPTGQSTKIGLIRKFHKLEKYPYSNCFDIKELKNKTYLIDKTVKLIGSYNKQLCQKLCVIDIFF